jgi:hypothetical protein
MLKANLQVLNRQETIRKNTEDKGDEKNNFIISTIFDRMC